MPRARRKIAKKQDDHKPIRCAIYTRKSTSEGLDQAFNSLDAQREACEAYVASQKHEGWSPLPHRYDDGGFSGGHTDRPALQQLLNDIEAGKIDAVVVYKVDRLSRSLLDFARIIKLFEDKQVHFVSVTQHFNTADSMGRLTLNILLSFAQFEREIIGERTRDKIAAARRKGKWSGGWPVLGYDIDRENRTLIVNEQEAKQVNAIFELYLKHESLIRVASALNRRGWQTKSWTTKKGKRKGGGSFDKSNVNYLLSNVIYRGQVRHRDDVYEGEHQAIIDETTWAKVQSILARNAKTKGAVVRNKHGALLKGLLRCKACNKAMVHSTANRTHRKHRYYVCSHAQKHGHNVCPTKSVNAHSIEQAVLDKLRQLPVDLKTLAASPLAETAGLFGSKSELLLVEDQARLLRRVMDRVAYDGRTKRLSIDLNPEIAKCVKASA
ncbi:MAG: recombinase family protein [Phycisphaerales bacterium]|nr:recombinase family protein [Phycisphaerales bacterium]